MSHRPIVVGFPFIGDQIGGSHISAVNLIASLKQSEVEPKIFLHKSNEALSKYLSDRHINFVALDDDVVLRPLRNRTRAQAAFDAVRYPFAVFRFWRVLRQHGVEIVHTNDGPMHATWALPTVLAGAKLFWHHRGDPQARGANMLAPLLASHVVTVSKFAQPSHPLIPLNDRISVIHSPFDHPRELPDREECRLALAQELGLDTRTRFVGYFGSLIDRKKPLRFVEAVHAFHQKNPDFPLVGLLFGRPEKGGLRLDEDAQALAASLGIADKIRLMGFRLPVAPYMRAVDILLVPALNEPFGRTLIEAMLLGTPVIATDHGGNPEAIDHGRNGYLVEPENPSAFVEPMETLLMNEEEWRRISETARASALASYGVEYHVNGITRLYQHILGRDPVNGRPH